MAASKTKLETKSSIKLKPGKKTHTGEGFKPIKILFYTLTIGYACIALFPFLWSFYTSLRPTAEVWNMDFSITKLTLDAYINMATKFPIFRWYFNSILVAVLVTIGNVLINSMAGYALARIDFPGRDFLFYLVLAIMMIPGQITMIPTYMLLSKLGWVNTYVGLTIPFVFSCFNTFMMRQFFVNLPAAIEEAAEIDGLGRLQIFLKVAFPLAKAPISTLIILSFMGSWNNFLFPNLLTTQRGMYTLPVGLASMNNQYYSFPNQSMAGAMYLSIPMIIVFLIFQNFFITGIANSGGKE